MELPVRAHPSPSLGIQETFLMESEHSVPFPLVYSSGRGGPSGPELIPSHLPPSHPQDLFHEGPCPSPSTSPSLLRPSHQAQMLTHPLS